MNSNNVFQVPTYAEFCRANNTAKMYTGADGKGTIGRVRNMSDVTHAQCEFMCMGNLSVVNVKQIVLDVYRDGMGVITNPSALKNWKGWGQVIVTV